MRRQRAAMVMAAAAALWCAAPLAVGCAAPAGAGQVPTGAVARAGAWRAAIEVPGTAALNKGGEAVVNSVSCASAGNCTAAGRYTDRLGHRQAFVASERNGTWHAAIEVRGTAALNKGGNANVVSVSCASAGNCLAGGFYFDSSRHKQAFVASERGGTWHAAIEVPGTAALNKRGDASVHSLSCASAGNCVVGGDYRDGSRHYQAFVASEANGSWHAAIEVPGTGALNKGGAAEVDSVSCASPGNCLAGGSYLADSFGTGQAFVASEANGTWHAAIELPGMGTLNLGRFARVDSVSCASPGNCAVGGFYNDDVRLGQAFVASEANGTWSAAIEVPGTGAVNEGGGGAVNSVSCGSAGNCVAGGSYTDGADHDRAFVASLANGTWNTAIVLNNAGDAIVNSVSCPSAGNCVAGGGMTDGHGHYEAFVASETYGTWSAAMVLPGMGTLNKGGSAAVNSVSCVSAGSCAAGGIYTDGRRHYQAFVASQT